MSDKDALSLEDRLWWVQGRKAIIREHLKRATRYGPITKIVDVGCGSGGNLDVLSEFGKVVGVEPSESLARMARDRGLATKILQEDASGLDPMPHTDLFTMFDVLEHIEDDVGFLRQLRAKGGPRHQILVSVPAFQFLYSAHDRMLHHYRRYSTKTLGDALEGAGYKTNRTSYFMFFLFPLALLARSKEKLSEAFGKPAPAVQIGDFPPFVAVPFAMTLATEAWLSRAIAITFPIGLWLFALATSAEQQNGVRG
jgi:SAM-dependent methyltransferase